MVKRIGLIWAVLVFVSLPMVRQALAGLTIDLWVPNAVNVVLFGREAEGFFGSDLAAGDINGDGLDDLAVGAPLAELDSHRNGAGEVCVYFGRPRAGWPALNSPPDITVYGPGEANSLGGDWYREPGHIVVGDLDQDGLGDLIVSAPEYGHGSTVTISRGRVWILWGRTDWPREIDLAAIPPELEVTTVSAAGRDFLGAALASGDFDGDGIGDVAMSAPSANNRAGIVYVIFGGSHLRNRSIQLGSVPADVDIFRAVGAVSNAKLGSYLAFGKLSDDTVDDLVIGSEQVGSYTGTVQIVFGSSQVRGETRQFRFQPADWTAIGEAEWDQLGRSLATGDLNADSRVDLVMGASTADGPAGPNAGQAIAMFGFLKPGHVQDLADQPGDLTVYGPQGGEDEALLGDVAVGDFNGDNVGDLLVGARYADGYGRSEAGLVYLFYGSPSLEGTRDLRVVAADIMLVGANARDFTGYVTAGDVDGDGIDDIITSANEAPGLGGNLQQAGAVYILFGSQQPPTPMPTLTPSRTPSVTRTPTPAPTRTATATPKPPNRLFLPLILRNHVGSVGPNFEE